MRKESRDDLRPQLMIETACRIMRQKTKEKLPGERNRGSVESPFLGALHILKMIPPSLSEKSFYFFGSDRAIFSIFFPDFVRARILLYDPGNKDDTVIVRTILEIGHCLNLRAVAEGVENHSQLAFLRQIECDEFQGFLAAKPMHPDELARLIRRQECSSTSLPTRTTISGIA